MATSALSLGDFVKQLAVEMTEIDVMLPFKDEAPWHLLFYRLKKEKYEGERPKFFEQLRFDWDGSYPKCRELSDFIDALHWTGSVGAINPTYERIVVQPEMAALWRKSAEKMNEAQKEFLHYSIEIAQQEFPKERQPASVDA